MARLNRPLRQNNQTTAEHAAEVEFAVREDFASLLTDIIVVFLRPAFLQSNDMGRIWHRGYAFSDLEETFSPVLGDELEAPAVEREDVNLGREFVAHFDVSHSRSQLGIVYCCITESIATLITLCRVVFCAL